MRTIRNILIKVANTVIATTILTFVTLGLSQGDEFLKALEALIAGNGADAAADFKTLVLTFLLTGLTLTGKDLIKELTTSVVKHLVSKALPAPTVETPVKTKSKGSKRAKAKAKAKAQRRARVKARAKR